MSKQNFGATRGARSAGFVRFGVGAGLLVAGALGAAALTAAGSPAAASVSAAAQVNGQTSYNTKCAGCHQANGEGVPGLYPPLAGSDWVTGSDERLVKVILHGLTGEIEVKGETYNSVMPAWGSSMNNAEVAALATYLRSAWGNKAAAVPAAKVASIRTANADRKKPWTAKELALSGAPKK